MVKILNLVWDTGNKAHIARHSVAPDDVIDVCYSRHITLKGKEGRIMVIGPAKTGRMLVVILAEKLEKHTYYVVTARSADKKERMLYTNVYE